MAAIAAVALVAAGAGRAENGTTTATEMSWTDAAEILHREKLSAESCARAFKRQLPESDLAALNEAERGYDAGRIEFNSVITGLQVALDGQAEDPALANVQDRITAGTEARRAFCDAAEAYIPSGGEGEKNVIADIVAAAAGEVVEAGVAIWSRLRDDDALRRASIRTALEDAKWPAFADIEP